MMNSHETELLHIRDCLSHQDYTDAYQVVRDILYEDPDCREALCFQGIILTETGHQAAALRSLRFYFRLGGSSPDAWEAYGCAHLRLHNWGQAEAALLRAIELAPEQGSTWRNLGVLYNQTDRNDESYAALRQSIARSPDDMLTMWALSSMHLRYGAKAEARALLVRLAGDDMPEHIREYARATLASLNPEA